MWRAPSTRAMGCRFRPWFRPRPPVRILQGALREERSSFYGCSPCGPALTHRLSHGSGGLQFFRGTGVFRTRHGPSNGERE
jgi:hypothetical protein